MEFQKVNDYAKEQASKEFGSNVIDKINNQTISSATGHLTYIRDAIITLTKCFEVQKLAYQKGTEGWLDEFHKDVKELIEGDGNQLQGLKKRLTIYFFNQEFTRDPEKKKAIALYLKFFIEYVRDNVEIIDIEDFLEELADKGYNGNYFDKNYVFGELLEIVNKQII